MAIGHETRESLRYPFHWGRDAGMAVLHTRALQETQVVVTNHFFESDQRVGETDSAAKVQNLHCQARRSFTYAESPRLKALSTSASSASAMNGVPAKLAAG